MNDYSYRELIKKWKTFAPMTCHKVNYGEWIADWKSYKKGCCYAMSVEDKLDFIEGVQKEFIPIFDENGNDMYTYWDHYEILNELRENPKLLSVEHIKRLMIIMDDDCFEPSWQKILAEVLLGLILAYNDEGIECYLQSLPKLPTNAHWWGCSMLIYWITEDKKGYDLLKKSLPKQTSYIQNQMLSILEEECEYELRETILTIINEETSY